MAYAKVTTPVKASRSAFVKTSVTGTGWLHAEFPAPAHDLRCR